MVKSNNPKTFNESEFERFLERYRFNRFGSLFKIFLYGTISFILIGGLGLGLWLAHIDIFSIKNEQLRAITEYQAPDNSLVLDKNGKKIGEYYSAYYVYTPLKKIPQSMIDAVIATEDQNFYKHKGIDLVAIIRATLNLIVTQSKSQGASTITQQVVRNFLLNREKTFERKVKELIFSLRLEKVLSKEQILEIYLNALFLGNGAYGVGAAAQRYFGKGIDQLSVAEHALIAGLFQSPSRFNPHRHPKRAKKRQRQVIVAMIRSGKLSKKEGRLFFRKKLDYKPYNYLNTEIAPYFVDYVKDEASRIIDKSVKNSGLRIYTTMDIEIQNKARETIHNSSTLLNRAKAYVKADTTSQKQRLEAALLVTEPQTGHILAMVGGRNYETSQFNRTIQAKRSPGSTFKPVIYSLALQSGYKWSDMFYVTPIAIDDYRPRNYSENIFLTETTLLRAFYKSINTTVVELGQKLGLQKILDHAKHLGIDTALKKESGTMLGSSELTMMDLARLYSVFANQGKLVQPIAITKITDRFGNTIYTAPTVEERSAEVISPHVAFLMTEGLRSVFKYGTAYNFRRLSPFAVGKTGTSNGSIDNWFCGYTPDLVSILWTGIDDHLGFEDSSVSAITLALPIWSSFIEKAIPLRPLQEFTPPEDGIAEHMIHPQFGNFDDNGIKMYFLEGQVPDKKSSSLHLISRTGDYRGIFNR